MRRELETWPWWNCDPTTQSKECGWKPSTYRARASSRPYDEIESERANVPKRSAAPNVSSNHRPIYPVEHRATSADGFHEPRRLPSGVHRILTALAQYPQGRSKAQVAVLAGYALNGGGFNNYLGALRSRGLIKGDGDRLTITDGESRRSVRGSRFQQGLLSSTTGAAD